MSEDAESAGSLRTAPDSPKSLATSSPSAMTSPCSSIGSRLSKRTRRAVPSVSAIAAAQNRSRQRSEEKESAPPPPESRTIRELILDQNSGFWSKSALQQRTNRKRKTNGDDESVRSSTPIQNENGEPQTQQRIAPQVRIVDGKIVLDHSSLTFASRPSLPSGFQLPVLDEDREGPAINSASFRKNRVAAHRWDQASTEKFFAALSKYGTDFETISRLFQGLNRRHIKNKFKLEERYNPHKVDAALLNRKPIDLDDFPEPEPAPGKVDESGQIGVDEESREIVDETSVHDGDSSLLDNGEILLEDSRSAAVSSGNDEALIPEILA